MMGSDGAEMASADRTARITVWAMFSRRLCVGPLGYRWRYHARGKEEMRWMRACRVGHCSLGHELRCKSV